MAPRLGGMLSYRTGSKLYSMSTQLSRYVYMSTQIENVTLENIVLSKQCSDSVPG